jgi:Lipase (class 3)
MTALSRIVFGEPKPGMARFAGILSKLITSESYCNRSGPLEHDRVTDLPFTVPALGLDYVHPTSLSFVRADPAPDDEYGIFAWHHSALYLQGARAAKLDPAVIEAARLCDAIYARSGTPPETWDEQLTTAGVYWAAKFEGARVFVVFRGSDSLLDWIRDLTGFDPAQIIQHDTFGAMWSGFLIGMVESYTAIKPLLAHADEVIVCGHSLGAARADILTAMILTAR